MVIDVNTVIWYQEKITLPQPARRTPITITEPCTKPLLKIKTERHLRKQQTIAMITIITECIRN